MTFDAALTLFPDLPGRPIGHRWGESAAARSGEIEQRAWWAEWERAHPAPRTCLFCGFPGGRIWLTIGEVGPRPCHIECASPAQPLGKRYGNA